MKNYSYLLFIIMLTSCGNSQSNSPGSGLAAKSSTTQPEEKTKDKPGTSSTRGEGIIGEWTLALEAHDDNDNKSLDEAERKKGFPNKYYYKFNADGTCLIHTMKFKGHYELKDENGKKKLFTYLDEDNPGLEQEYEIISVTTSELILLWGYTFWVFKSV